ncbi:hypothetical protein HBNXHx_1720 [Haloferax volcanii]|nr:hypothetical protein HBNXHx_1720 [Haloferax alexandrinus]
MAGRVLTHPTVLEKPAMSTKQVHRKSTNDESQADRFVPVGSVNPMTEAKLRACNQVEASDDGDHEVAVFAVAHRHGVIQNTIRKTDQDGEAVLYMTADGERCTERWYRVLDGEFEEIDRAFIADGRHLDEADEVAKRFAPIVQRHPEVGE